MQRAFTICNAKKQPRPEWYNMYQRLVALLDQMMATCAQATYNAMKWKINPAEFIHVIRVHEGAAAPAPGEAGDGGLRQLLWSSHRSQLVFSHGAGAGHAAPQATKTLPLQSLAQPVEEAPVDCVTSCEHNNQLVGSRDGPFSPGAQTHLQSQCETTT